ncbi:hypothetical protein Rhe02_37900 [Rhizocola hellebori]|uniref:Uncharacterized protein n=1 Tax=Rhizocola hellebori TaxID=1392758 RepID=A0A8J3Q9M5_9ACTN|nr:hypothetical protein [Rhizocola hellebori]GIH05723.1 hypothetical protein Rhe02_37900 [Rhizocola hellebori]
MNRQLQLVTPPIDSIAACRHCDLQVIWDEVSGWTHLAPGQAGPVDPPHLPDADWPLR